MVRASFRFVSLFALAGAGLALTSATAARAAEELKIIVGVSAMDNIFNKIREPFEKSTGVKLVFLGKEKGNGSDEVMRDVDQGLADCGAGGIHWDGWLQLMRDENYAVKSLADIKYRVIGRDRIQIMTDKSGPKKLSLDEIKGLLSGKVRNWKEIGGADLPVKIVLTSTQPATQKFLEERVIEGKLKTEGAKVTSDSGAMIKAIAATPGSIGFGPIDLVDSTINVPEHPTMGRPITFIWKGKPTGKITRLLDFIHDHGKQYGVPE